MIRNIALMIHLFNNDDKVYFGAWFLGILLCVIGAEEIGKLIFALCIAVLPLDIAFSIKYKWEVRKDGKLRQC